MDPSNDSKAYTKLAQLKKALEDKSDIKIVKNILEKEGDINYAIPNSSLFRFSEPNLIGYTALHFAIHKSDAFVYLLNHGADFIKKNEAGQTALHMLIEPHQNIKEPLDDLLVTSVLSAHVTRNNFFNPCNNDGLSHFHIACMTNNSRAVEFFLDNGISVDHPVCINSKFLPGYTPLHFAAMCTNTKVAEILLSYGADMHILNASGKTVLHVLIERRMQMFESVGKAMSDEEGSYKKLQVQIQENDKLISMLLENMSCNNDCLDSIGLSDFHVACMLQDISVAENLADRVTDINHCVHKDSKLWPGYTALHFAAHFSNSTVEMLIDKGANIESKDSNGMTPLDICIQTYQIEEIIHIMSLDPKFEKLLFSDGKTKVTSLIGAFTSTDSKCFKKFIKDSIKDINMQIPMESTLWPGYTPLHLAVLFAERQEMDFEMIIRICLNQGADLGIQDSRGCTPVHLAFRLNKLTVVDRLFYHSRMIPNVSDEENLSHLHILCVCRNTSIMLKKFILGDLGVSVAYTGTLPVNCVKPGWTPLHACLVNQRSYDAFNSVLKILLDNGANPYIQDAYGLTPIHWILACSFFASGSRTENRLLNQVQNDSVAEEYGVSNLHVVCKLNNYDAAKRFLENGANVNSVIKYSQRHDNEPLSFLSRFEKYTPLHFFENEFTDTTKLLLENGADVFAEKADGSTPLNNSKILHYYLTRLSSNVELQKYVRREYGWTKLHVNCYLLKIDGFENLVKAELADVNAQVFSNSPIWKGFTPLHVFSQCTGNNVYDIREKIYSMSKILLENGADVTMIDDEKNTPLMLILTTSFDVFIIKLLMNHHKNFDVNPVNVDGLSHFHLACFFNDVAAVEGFLTHGDVDVNHPVDFFSDLFPGDAPLHLASKLPVIELLINHGADVHAEDLKGSTVLHKAVQSYYFDENVIKKIIASGVEINRPNFYGITPFEKALSNDEITVEKLTFFIRHGFSVNSCNPITGVGYLSIVLGKRYEDKKFHKLILEIMMNERSTNILGRTTFHHLVTGPANSSFDYVAAFEKLIKAGYDIDQQDSEGKTALHLATAFKNIRAIEGLLSFGADINILDIHGQSALSHSKSMKSSSTDTLIVHACRLVMLKLYLNQIDVDNVKNARQSIHDIASNSTFFDQVALSQKVELKVRSIRFYDFLSETGAIIVFPLLNQTERCQIDQYFAALTYDDTFSKIKGFLKLQYRKAVKRLELLFPAMDSFRRLLGFNFPDLCAENLFQYLDNSDLKNIIQAAMQAELTEDVRMDVE